MAATELIDPSRLHEIRRDYGALADQLIDVFRRSAASTVTEIGTAVDRADEDETKRLAHRLKGSARNVGAIRVAELSGRLDDAGTACPDDLVTLSAVIRQTCTALRAALDG